MAKRPENRVYSVAVVGLSGTEKEKGSCGIGKSCLINRFMRPLADDYYTDHISVLSQSDFAGRVVNNDHFLYWGDTTKTDDGLDFRFNVIEQTEFVDDSSFQSFRIGKTDPYYKRCAMCKLHSAEKLAYICKNQLGLEHEFEQKMLPDGRINIDGFLCLFDVSQVSNRPIERQVDYTFFILTQLIKTKKPVILVTTKNDEVYRPYVSEAEKLVNRKELREKGVIPIVETSAHENVNVELAFMTLAYAIDKSMTKNRSKIVSYADANRANREVMDVAREAYLCLIRSQVTDYKTLWVPIHRRLQSNSDFIHFVELFGTDQASRLFRRHVNALREEFVKQKENWYLSQLDAILREILPDLNTISDRSWYSILNWLGRQDFFSNYFVVVQNNISWKDSDLLETTDNRIPFDLLESSEAETIFRNYVNLLRAEYRKAELKRQFRQLLEDNHHISPGKSLSEVAIFFLGRECFSSLSEKDKQEIYEDHQRAIKEKAKLEFHELLLENAEIFFKFERTQVTNEDIKDINERLQNEQRYKALSRMEDDRRAIMLNHLGFIQHASRDRCHFRDCCAENLIDRTLSKARRPQSWNRNSQFLLDAHDNNLHFVILGDEYLADQLAAEIQMQCHEDEYQLDGELFSIDYRTISGDVNLPSNSFKTPNFVPHGCFCVYNSLSTLAYIQQSLEKTMLSDLAREDRPTLQGLPIVLVLGHQPDTSERDLVALRVKGQDLADRLQSPFIDIPSSMMVDSSRRFHEDQIGLAMHQLVRCIKQRSFVNPWHMAESIEPDLRIMMCFMCGDTFTVEFPLAPLLNHQFCYVSSDENLSINLETFLDDLKRKVEVTATSYHSASQLTGSLFHGYILVYSVRRRASLSNLKAFATKINSVPVKILAVTETGANVYFTSESVQMLLKEGNAFADSIHASFMTTCTNFQTQIASYTPFFEECWRRKANTEMAFTFSKESVGAGYLIDAVPDKAVRDRMRMRPPAALPKRLVSCNMAKSSTSNSADDSDPAFLDPNGDRIASESDREQRDSSTSLHHGCESSIYEEVYSEIAGQDTEQLIKSTPAKTKRNVYAGYSPGELINDVPVVEMKKSSSVIVPKSGHAKKKSFDPRKFGDVTSFLGRKTNTAQSSSSPQVKAPLATPEHIEFGDYAQVKDAIPDVILEDHYASVADALPHGRVLRIRSSRKKSEADDGSDTDSEGSSVDEVPKDPWVNRRVPYKKKQRSRRTDGTSYSPGEDHQAPLLHSDQLDKVRDYSASDGSEGTPEEQVVVQKQKKKRSIRNKKKAATLEPDAQLAWTDTDVMQTRKTSVDEDGLCRDLEKLRGPADELSESGNWRRKLRLRSEKDTDSEKRKEEKKAREKEQRRSRQEKSKLKDKSLRKSKKIYTASNGLTLGDLVQSEENLVPLFLQKCITHIEAEGLNVEGLYRVPGNKAQVDVLIEKFKEDPDVDISKMDIPVNVVATAVKAFFSELSEPVIPLDLYDKLKDAICMPDKTCRLLVVRGIIKKLPPANFAVLRYVVSHINRVSKHSLENSMDAKNLAICWWPTLMRPVVASLETMYLTTKPLEEILLLLIEQLGFFFYGENEVS